MAVNRFIDLADLAPERVNELLALATRLERAP
jgi:hypothetical protein